MSNRAQNKTQNAILDSITEGIFTIDLDLRITSFNRAAEEITGIQREKAIGQKCRDVLSADARWQQSPSALIKLYYILFCVQVLSGPYL